MCSGHFGAVQQVRKFSANLIETLQPFVDQDLVDSVQELGDGRKRN